MLQAGVSWPVTCRRWDWTVTVVSLVLTAVSHLAVSHLTMPHVAPFRSPKWKGNSSFWNRNEKVPKKKKKKSSIRWGQYLGCCLPTSHSVEVMYHKSNTSSVYWQQGKLTLNYRRGNYPLSYNHWTASWWSDIVTDLFKNQLLSSIYLVAPCLRLVSKERNFASLF